MGDVDGLGLSFRLLSIGLATTISQLAQAQYRFLLSRRHGQPIKALLPFAHAPQTIPFFIKVTDANTRTGNRKKLKLLHTHLQQSTV